MQPKQKPSIPKPEPGTPNIETGYTPFDSISSDTDTATAAQESLGKRATKLWDKTARVESELILMKRLSM